MTLRSIMFLPLDWSQVTVAQQLLAMRLSCHSLSGVTLKYKACGCSHSTRNPKKGSFEKKKKRSEKKYCRVVCIAYIEACSHYIFT